MALVATMNALSAFIVGFPMATTPVHDKPNQRVCRGYQRSHRNWEAVKKCAGSGDPAYTCPQSLCNDCRPRAVTRRLPPNFEFFHSF